MYSKGELAKLKTEFWESFSAYCSVQPLLQNRKKMWLLYNTKVKGVELKFDIKRTGVSVILEVNNRDEEKRLETFEKLTWYKDILEKGFEEEVMWDICYVRETGKEVARIYVSKADIDYHRRDHWGEYFQFMSSRMYLLEKNFRKIAEYLRE